MKAKPENDESELHQIFKRYRNMTVTLCKQSKSNYYRHYFNQYSDNMHKVWQGIPSRQNSRKGSVEK